MRTAPNIVIKRNRLGTNYSNIRLPKNGEIVDIENNVFQVYKSEVSSKGSKHQAEIVLDTMDGSTTIEIKVISQKPFREK